MKKIIIVLCGAIGLMLLQVTLAQQNGLLSSEVERRLIKIFSMGSEQSLIDKLDSVNAFFNNNIEYKSDLLNYGIEDYWASPIETIASGYGDCEDFAIAKYYSLLKMDIPIDKMSLMYVIANIDGKRQAHMVLGVYMASHKDPLILDNLTNEVRFGSERKDLSLVYKFNDKWLTLNDGNGERYFKYTASGLSKWESVIYKVNNFKSHIFR